MSEDHLTITTILCGTDGSPDAQHAVAHSASLARQLGAEVVLVHAVGLLEHLPADPVDPAHPQETVGDRAAKSLEAEWSQPLRDQTVVHRCLTEAGPPLLVLPRIAERVDADLIVVASHGRGVSSALPLGSTAHGMVQLADRPIMVVPRLSSTRR